MCYDDETLNFSNECDLALHYIGQSDVQDFFLCGIISCTT